MAKRASSVTAEPDSLAQLAAELQLAEEELAGLRDVADEIRELLAHAECNPQAPQAEPFRLVSMSIDPCAEDFAAQLNRNRPEDLPIDMQDGYATFSMTSADGSSEASVTKSPAEGSPTPKTQQHLF